MGQQEDDDAQLALMPDVARARARAASRRAAQAAKRSGATEPAADLPVARVLVDVPLAHLDRPFDYLVPQKMADAAVAGARVKVRFAGQDVDGFLLDRLERTEHEGRLAPLRRVVSPEPVLSAAVARLCATVAARYAGTRSDVLRLAVPSRHAAVEKEQPPPPPGTVSLDAEAGHRAWDPYVGGARFADRLASRESPRAVWAASPGEDWPRLLAYAAAATYAGGRGALLCLPDGRDVVRVDEALRDLFGKGHHVALTAELGPAARYRAFLAVSRGTARIVVGTRAAAFAPVPDLGLVAVWDDGDDLHAEPRAPYPHAREVLLLRAHGEGCAALVGGFARTAEAEQLVESGWADGIVAPRAAVRAASARVGIAGATDAELARDAFARSARLPKTAHEAIRAGLQAGPVLLQTPRRGYLTALACEECRTPARCARCSGPMALPAPSEPPSCRWCGVPEHGWTCAACGGRGLRAPVLGERRTAEEIGRAFPAVPVRTSAGDRVLAGIGAKPSVVVATPGAEPRVDGGYACVVLLDTWLMLARPDLRIAEESLRRWFNAAALARPASRGGRVVAVGDSGEPVLQALVRWDPAGFARRELAERHSAHLPPASRLATLSADPSAVAAFLEALELPPGAEVLGPVPVETGGGRGAPEPSVRAVVRVPRHAGAALSRALVREQGARDAKKLPRVRVQVDPMVLG